MIVLYSVIIQSQKTMESFSQLHPLFMEAISEQKIGICKWMKAGTTIDTAVPELCSLTNNKEEWRAIIVRCEDERDATQFEADPFNPYDFLTNCEDSSVVQENPVPLVRLTQILGGIPVPDIRFGREQIIEENKTPRMIYRPVANHEEEDAYNRLVEKYRYDGKAPSEIIIVSQRNKPDVRVENVKNIWKTHREICSSEFWKRNRYPSICRFLVYDINHQGPVQRDADNFGFWLSIMLLATNHIEPSSLQAYKLYSLKAEIDDELMQQTFQHTVNRLVMAKHIINESIRRDISESIQEESKLPDYRLEIPVSFKLPENAEYSVTPTSFKLISKGLLRDLNEWRSLKNVAESGVNAAIHSGERVLDQTADRLRGLHSFSENEVSKLDKYQEEDLTHELDDIHRKVMLLQSTLPCDSVAKKVDAFSAEKKVSSYLLGRVTQAQALGGILLAVALMILAAIPAVVFIIKNSEGILWGLAAALGIGIGAFAITEALVLVYQKYKLTKIVNDYNKLLDDSITELFENGDAYSRYMSGIASHSKGSSYLNMSRRKKHRENDSHHVKNRHLKAINQLLGKLESWSDAYHLSVNYESDNVDEDLNIDTEIPPHINPLYTFETDIGYQVKLNATGDTIESPFGFVDKLRIVREELYDDAERD